MAVYRVHFTIEDEDFVDVEADSTEAAEQIVRDTEWRNVVDFTHAYEVDPA